MSRQSVRGDPMLSIGPSDTEVSQQYFAAKTPATWNVTVLDAGDLDPVDYTVSISSSGELTVTLLDGSDIPASGTTLTILVSASSGPGQGNNASLSVSVAIASPAVPCFTSGTVIETPDGPRAVEEFAPGDLVLTMDNGIQKVRWVGQTLCSKRDLDRRPQLYPIRVRAGVMGNGQPAQDLLVSPQHRVLVRSRIAERMFGQSEILVAAKQLLVLDGIEIADDLDEVIYVHLLCDQHEIIYSNGTPTETLYLGTEATKLLDNETIQELALLFPDLTDEFDMKPSRYFAPGRRSRSMAERHKKNGRSLLEELPLT